MQVTRSQMIGCRWMGLKCKGWRLPHTEAHGQRGFASERSPGMFAGILDVRHAVTRDLRIMGSSGCSKRSRFCPDGGTGESNAPPGLHEHHIANALQK